MLCTSQQATTLCPFRAVCPAKTLLHSQVNSFCLKKKKEKKKDVYLRQVVEPCAVFVLLFQALCMAEGQGVQSGVRGLLAAGNQEVVVEKLGGEIHDGLVRAVVLAQHDHARALAGVEVVQALQEGNVESLLSGVVGVHFGADLKEATDGKKW